MNTYTRLRLALALAAVATLSLTGCTDEQPTRPTNTNAPVAAGTNTSTTPTVAPPTNTGELRPPIEMKDTIEGKVIGLLCYKNTPNAAPEAAIACAKQMVKDGGALGVLGADGTVYIGESDPRSNNTRLEFFIGETVTVQGVMLGDLPDLGWDNVKVKKFSMKMVRRKGPPAPGTEKQMVPGENRNTTKK
jgi:hypothetical protein